MLNFLIKFPNCLIFLNALSKQMKIFLLRKFNTYSNSIRIELPKPFEF